jgi:Protein of unknown function (DUF3352)
MKKSFAVLIVVSVLAISLLFVVKQEKKEQISPASFLPVNAVAYYHQKDLSRSLDDFKKSRLGLALGKIDVIQTAKDLNFHDKDIPLLKKMRDEGSAFIESPLFDELFGNDFTVALLSNKELSTENNKEIIQKGLVLISKPKHGARLIDLLASGFDKVLNQKTEIYDDYTIKSFKQEGDFTVSVVTVHDLVFISLNDRLIKDCIDRYNRELPSLADNKNFQKARGMFKDPDLFGYLALDLLNEHIEKLLASADPEGKKLIKAELKKWKGMQAAGYGVWKDNDRIKDKGVVIIDTQKFDPAVKKIYKTASEKNSTLAIVPENVLGYYWTNTMDFPTYWRMYLAGENIDKKKVGEIRDAVQRQFGMSIEDILGMLDKQCGLMIQEGDANKFLPLPEFSIFVHIKDKKNFGEFFHKFLANSALSIKTLTYKGEDITSMASISQGGLMRLYTMHNDYLVATTSMAMMKQVIDVMQGGAGLKDRSGFKKVSTGLLDQNNSVAYIRIGELIKTIKDLTNWGRALMAVRDQEGSRKFGIVMDRIVNPIFDGLSMYSDFGMRSRISPDMITVESTTLIHK